MHWIAVSSPAAQIREYHLHKEENIQAVLRYNPAQNSIRIRSGSCHRLLYVHSAGSLSGRIIFHNEYGIETGQMQWDRWAGSQVLLQLGEHEYRCQVNSDTASELTVMAPLQQHIGSCQLMSHLNSTPLPFTDHPFLLPGLCWYLSLKEAEVMV